MTKVDELFATADENEQAQEVGGFDRGRGPLSNLLDGSK